MPHLHCVNSRLFGEISTVRDYAITVDLVNIMGIPNNRLAIVEQKLLTVLYSHLVDVTVVQPLPIISQL